MSAPGLWTAAELRDAVGGSMLPACPASGISIDSRTVGRGELFVALRDARDGHDFVADALARGACCAMVDRDPDGVPADAPLKDVLESAPVQAHFQRVVDQLAAGATGSANRVARLHLMHEPPSIDKSEVTDKGSINQRAVLQQRAALVAALHEGTVPFTIQPQGEAQ